MPRKDAKQPHAAQDKLRAQENLEKKDIIDIAYDVLPSYANRLKRFLPIYADAEDLIQDVLTLVAKKGDQNTPSDSLNSKIRWLKAAAKNIAHSQYRSKKRQEDAVQEIIDQTNCAKTGVIMHAQSPIAKEAARRFLSELNYRDLYVLFSVIYDSERVDEYLSEMKLPPGLADDARTIPEAITIHFGLKPRSVYTIRKRLLKRLKKTISDAP